MTAAPPAPFVVVGFGKSFPRHRGLWVFGCLWFATSGFVVVPPGLNLHSWDPLTLQPQPGKTHDRVKRHLLVCSKRTDFAQARSNSKHSPGHEQVSMSGSARCKEPPLREHSHPESKSDRSLWFMAVRFGLYFGMIWKVRGAGPITWRFGTLQAACSALPRCRRYATRTREL